MSSVIYGKDSLGRQQSATKIALQKWLNGVSQNPAQEFKSADYELLTKLVNNFEFELDAPTKERISAAVVSLIRKESDLAILKKADEFFTSLSKKDLLNCDYIENGKSLLIRAAIRSFRNLSLDICEKCSELTLNTVGGNNDTVLIWTVRNNWFEESKRITERIGAQKIDLEYSSNSENNKKTVLTFIAENKFTFDQKKELFEMLIHKGARVDSKTKESNFYKEFSKPPHSTTSSPVASSLLKTKEKGPKGV
jgi:hypothetical protein